MGHVTYMDKSDLPGKDTEDPIFVCVEVMSHTIKSCHMYERVMSHI